MPNLDGTGPSNKPKKRAPLRSGGQCVCITCGYKTAHERGVPCATMKCPKCGSNMRKNVVTGLKFTQK